MSPLFPSSTKHIAVVGAGQVGSRHLQAFTKIKRPIVLYAVARRQETLEICRTRLQVMDHNPHVQKIVFLRSIADLPAHLDLCVIATNSNTRWEALQQLAQSRSIDYLILEKVLFPSLEEGQWARDLLTQMHTRTWVNHPRRMLPLYGQLRTLFCNLKEPITYTLEEYTNFGLCCCAIHSIDHLCFLSGETLVSLDGSGLHSTVHAAKRPGFIEFSGQLSGTFSGGSSVTIIAHESPNRRGTIRMDTSSVRAEIHEQDGWVKISHRERDWQATKQPFSMPLQSEMGHEIAQEILETGHSSLTDFFDAWQTHQRYLQTLLQHYTIVTGKPQTYCPIT